MSHFAGAFFAAACLLAAGVSTTSHAQTQVPTQPVPATQPSRAQQLMGDIAPKTLLAMVLPTASALAQTGQDVVVQRAGSQAPSIGGAQNFTGTVRVDGRFQGSSPARISGGTVTFEPGARTAWHTHPLGQTLIVTAGVGLVQPWGGAIQEIRPGDVVWIPPGVKHWHGAAATTGMTHVAISEALDGKTVEWMEHVSDEQYRR